MHSGSPHGWPSMLTLGLTLSCCLGAEPGPASRPAAGERPQLDAHGDALPDGASARLGTVRLRNGYDTTAVALSANGHTLATVSREGTADTDKQLVRVWELPEGREAGHLPLQEFGTSPPTFGLTPDGRTLVTVDPGDRTSAWDAATGRLIRRFDDPPPGLHLHRFQLAPTGETWLGTTDKGLLCLWDVRTGKLARQITCRQNDYLAHIACAPEGKRVAVSGFDGPVEVWDLAEGKQVASLPGPPRPLSALALGAEGKLLAVGTEKGCVRVADVATGKVLHEVTVEGEVRALLFQADGRSLIYHTHLRPPTARKRVTYVRRHQIEVDPKVGALGAIDLDSGKARPLADTGPGVACLSADGKRLALASGPAVRLWDMPEGKELRPRPPSAGLKQLAVLGGRLVALTADGAVTFWDDPAGRPKLLRQLPGRFSCLAADPAGRTLATGDAEGRLALWSADGREKRREWPGHDRAVLGLAFGPGGGSLASSEAEGGARVWDVRTGEWVRGWARPRRGARPDDSYLSLAFAPDGRSLAATTPFMALFRWDLRDGEPFPPRPKSHSDKTSGCCYLPDGERLLSWGCPDTPGGLVEDFLRRRTTDSPIAEVYSRDAAVLSPDGLYLAAGGQTGDVRVYEVPTWGEVAHFRGHRGPVSCVTFSPDGRTLFGGSLDATALAWDLRAGATRGEHDEKADPEKLWAALAGEAPEAHRALWALAADPERGVPLLRERLLAAGRGQGERLTRLVKQLADDDFEVRQKATEELKKEGPAADLLLRRLLRDGQPDAEARRRAEGLVAALADAPVPAEHLRQLRGLAALERMGTDGAWRAVEDLAALEEGAWLREAARAALERKARRTAP
jgi:WD40 repeat protein